MKNIFGMLAVGLTLTACGESETLVSKTYTMMAPENDVQITLGFDTEAGKYYGSVVNRFFGDYTIDGDKINMGAAGATRMMGPPDAMAAEGEFLMTLETVVSYEVSDDNLILITDDGEKLNFVEVVE